MTTIAPPSNWPLTPERPAVVIAIPHWNRLELLLQCLDALQAHTTYPYCRICVFDQGSTDGSVDYLHTIAPDIDVVFSPVNIGFTGASNAIIERYPAWDVVLLNNDTRVTAGWLQALVGTATRADTIGLVGGALVSSDGVLQEAGGDVFADGRVRARGRAASASDPRYQERREADFCSAACLYVKRSVFDRCGSLERVYESGYFEDVDLAFKARAAGFKVIYEPACVVVHDEHSSFGADAAAVLMRRHREIFRARWTATLSRQPASAFELTDGGARPRLLLVSDLVPGNMLSPRMRRIRQLIRRLNTTFEIAYLNVAVEGLDRYAAVIEELGATPFHPVVNGTPGVSGLDEAELLRVNYFPVALCGSADAAVFLRARFPAAMLDATTVVVDIGMEADAAGAAGRSGAGHFLVMTDGQRSAVLGAMPDSACAVLPPYPESTTSHRAVRELRTDIVMLCDNTDGPAAALAVAGMVRAIVPTLQRQPYARVRLGGGTASPELLAEAPAGLEILPRSTPIGAVLDCARVVVVPQHWCSPDTISNVAEARARAIPIVASSAVVRGAGLSGGVNAIAVDTPEAFAEQIARVYSDPWLWDLLARGDAASPARLAPADALPLALTTWASGAVLTTGSPHQAAS